MVDVSNIKRVYFIGIGGIGMSAIARYFHFHGKKVSGYDKTETTLTRALVEEGIEVHYHDKPEEAPRDADIVVYTPAIPADQQELQFYRANGYPILKRSEVLGIITADSYNICVAGTHGKTTISSMIAHILRHTGYGCNAFLGGISANYNSNYWSDRRKVCVVEADEYDRSFLKLHPDVAVISAMDADHLDIYGTEDSMHESFIDFTGKLKKDGVLVHKLGLPKADKFLAETRLSYAAGKEEADIAAGNIRMNDGTYQFEVSMGDWHLRDVQLNMGGMHNVENVTVAIGIAHYLGIEDALILDAVQSYKGVRRRFEYIIKTDSLVYIDDYAHHPEELRVLINGARSLFPGKRMTVVFQPHLFSRTRDFADGFAEVLGTTDELVLLPIYPARELPIEGVDSEMLLERVTGGNKRLLKKSEVVDYLLSREIPAEGELIITAGAGDIDTLVKPISEQFQKKQAINK